MVFLCLIFFLWQSKVYAESQDVVTKSNRFLAEVERESQNREENSGPLQSLRTSRFQKLTQKLQKDSFVLAVGSASGREPEYMWQGNRLMIPASVTKLVTSLAVLRNFPPGTRFKTQLFRQGSQKGDVLEGDLILVGQGNPTFVSEDMWNLVNQFTREGIKKVRGNLILDDTFFDSVKFDPSRQDKRVDRAYDAPVGALSFNWNSVNIFVRPNLSQEKARVWLDPQNDFAGLKSSIKTVSRGATQIEVDRIDLKVKNEFSLSGQISTEMKEKVAFASVTDPTLWTGENLVQFLKQRGVEFESKPRLVKQKKPDDAVLVAEIESKPVEWIVADMNKFSNNFVAEMLTKLLGTKVQSPGTLPLGMQVIEKEMLQIGLKNSEFKLVNPSGLTRENRLTAKALWTVLAEAYQDAALQPEFVASLPISGVDGTLKNRFKRGSGAGLRRVRAKTGLLTGVTSLAGFVSSSDSRQSPIAFVFMHNQPDGKEIGATVRELFDQVALSLGEN